MGFRGLLAVPALGSLLVVCLPALAAGQTGSPYKAPTGHVVALASGSIAGAVRDEYAQAVAGCVVSAIGEMTTFAVTGARGHFELGSLSPGQYLVRAHLAGFVSPRAQTLDVRPALRTPSSIALRRASRTVLAAGVALPSSGQDNESASTQVSGTAGVASAPASSASDQSSAADGEEHGETAWRIRHTRRGILKDVTLTEAIDDHPGGVGPTDLLERAVNAPARLAASFFADTPFSGEVNLLTI